MSTKDTIWVVSADSSTARKRLKAPELKVEELSINVNLFLDQAGNLLEKTPEKLGKFQFIEFEVHAEVSDKGTLAILGTGGEVGATGGLTFVSRRLPISGQQ